jgi:glycosidase
MEDLKALVETAHRHGIRVLIDLAANHVHEESPIWAMHKDWFNQDPIICSDDDNWNQHPIDCWFQPYLPDLDFRNLDALNAFTDAAIFWAVEADIDGFRVDAVKHMIHDFSRTLRWKTKKRLETTGVEFILLGETFDGREKIKEYIGQNELQGQFDFPLYFTIVSAFARDETGLDTAISEYETSRGFFGNDALMSNFLGNHDVPRFISHAAGQIPSSNPNDERVKKMAWENPPSLPADTVPFSKLKMAFTFLLTLPGIPLIYYGDEIGLPGAGDPDNRRMMEFQELSENQVSLRQAIEILGKTRHAHRATRYGQLIKFVAEPSFLAYAVITADDVVIVILNKGSNATRNVDVSSVISGSQTLTDVFSGRTYQVSSGVLNISVAPFEALVLVKESD